jgi:hypothetical protein
MGIEKPAPPQQISEIAASMLNRLPQLSVGGVAPAVRAARGKATVAEPHKVYTLGLDGIVEDANLARTKMVGWRYLVMSGDQALASTEVKQDDQGGAPEFSHLSASVHGPNSLAEIRKAEQDPRYRQGSYELRLLKIPGLDLRALWLKDKRGNDDVLIPIAPTHSKLLTPSRPYSVQELIAAVRELARKRLEFDSSPRAAPAESEAEG